ncbi:MAG: class I adenylate-forming enzyme family protein, partial [Microgenomates group bacterium]
MTTPQLLIKDGKTVTYQPPFNSISQFLTDFAHENPDKDALVFVSSSGKTVIVSRSTFAHTCAQLARALSERWHLTQAQKLNAVSFCLPNTPEVITCNYAAWSLGLTTVPLDNTRDTTERKIYKLQQARAGILFTRNDANSKAENKQIAIACPDLIIVELESFEDFLHNHLKNVAPLDNYPEVDFDAPSLILYTSGTTALPKGVALTIKSLFANAESIKQWLQFSEHDRWQVVLPLHHINSTTFVNTTLFAGGTIVLIEKYSKSKYWQFSAQTQSTGASIVPTIAYDLLSEQKSFAKYQEKLRQFNRFQLGSAPVQPRVVEDFMNQFTIPLYQGYGQTETSLRSTGVPMDLTPEQFSHIRKSNSLGTELAFTNVAVLDEKGRELEDDAVGEICVRGPIIMKQYIDNEVATAEAFAHGWFHSGDTGYHKTLYDRKFFFLKGRSKEIIKKGGVLLSPLAIENALLAHYSDLDQVYVVGFEDARLGERVGFVAVTENSSLVKKILEDGKNGSIPTLKPYEIPESGLRVSEEDLPKTATGKVQRLEIKKLFATALLDDYRTIFLSTDNKRFRLLGPEEEKVLLKATEIDENRWGSHLAGSLLDFIQRAQNGALIGAFDAQNNLLGTISAVRLKKEDILQSKDPNYWSATWDGITGNGTLNTNNHKGNALLLVSVAVASKSKHPALPKKPPVAISPELLKKSIQNLQKYANSGTDSVLKFHARPKAG